MPSYTLYIPVTTKYYILENKNKTTKQTFSTSKTMSCKKQENVFLQCRVNAEINVKLLAFGTSLSSSNRYTTVSIHTPEYIPLLSVDPL